MCERDQQLWHLQIHSNSFNINHGNYIHVNIALTSLYGHVSGAPFRYSCWKRNTQKGLWYGQITL